MTRTLPITTVQLDRRKFVIGSAATCAAVALAGSPARAAGISEQYASLDSDRFLGEFEVLAKIEDDEVFTEGPAVARDGTVLFTNVPASKILRWSPQTKKLDVFRDKSNKTNGLLFAPNGDLLACEGGAGRVTRTDARTGEVTVVASEFNGFPFAAPNDLCLDRQGRLYFTARPGGTDPKQGNVNAVYRVDPDGEVMQVLHWPDIHMPNGIVLSPDEKTLYLIEAHPDADQHRDIRAYDVDDEGDLLNEHVLINFYPGRSGDGMCIDAEGNLYVAAGLHKTRKTNETLDTRPGIHVISPQGKLLAFRETPVDTITNCSFGGDDLRSLYVACGNLLLRIPTKIAGKASYRPQR